MPCRRKDEVSLPPVTVMEITTKTGVLSISDKGSRGERRDKSGEILTEVLNAAGYPVQKKMIIPDDRERIRDVICEWVDQEEVTLIVTTGGTGLSPTDVTPQAMREIIDYEVPGMSEAMRAESLRKTPHAMLSRAMVGVRRSCLIINLPGSPIGAEENLKVVLPALRHALEKLAGDPSECAN
jgi:molybdenum cofactor synthesis domain-containing protein